jgi:hypothetical protein
LSWKPARAVRLLLDRLGDRLIVHCVLDRGRLLDLWEWAKQMGVRHLDATILEDSAIGDGTPQPGRLREIRNDLLALCDEMADELAAQRLPIDFKPLTRIVDRLMRSEPLDPPRSGGGALAALLPVADSYPRSFLESFDLRSLTSFRESGDETVEPAVVEAAGPCQNCWARQMCSHSACVTAVQNTEDSRERTEQSCALWRTEAEAALRFYHRLAHTDPLQVRRFFEDSSREVAPAPGLREDLGYLRMPF